MHVKRRDWQWVKSNAMVFDKNGNQGDFQEPLNSKAGKFFVWCSVLFSALWIIESNDQKWENDFQKLENDVHTRKMVENAQNKSELNDQTHLSRRNYDISNFWDWKRLEMFFFHNFRWHFFQVVRCLGSDGIFCVVKDIPHKWCVLTP